MENFIESILRRDERILEVGSSILAGMQYFWRLILAFFSMGAAWIYPRTAR